MGTSHQMKIQFQGNTHACLASPPFCATQKSPSQTCSFYSLHVVAPHTFPGILGSAEARRTLRHWWTTWGQLPMSSHFFFNNTYLGLLNVFKVPRESIGRQMTQRCRLGWPLGHSLAKVSYPMYLITYIANTTCTMHVS